MLLILYQSYHELTLKPLIFRPSRHFANVTLIVLRVAKTNTKLFGPVEFIFPAFEVIRLSKTGKPQKTGKFTWLTMWLIVVTNFFSVTQCIFIRESQKWARFAVRSFIQELSLKNHQIFDKPLLTPLKSDEFYFKIFLFSRWNSLSQT